MNKIVIILGADDPEMNEIEHVLDVVRSIIDRGDGIFHRAPLNGGPVQVSVVYAKASGRRVHAGNAYSADPVAELVAGDTLIRIECEPRSIPDEVTVVVIDHHRPGDPGYGLAPASYWEASSLGQLWNGLRMGKWGLYLPDPEHPAIRWDNNWASEEPRMRTMAAMDHCFAAAVRGECPGVTPGDVLDLKIVEIARATRSEECDVRERIEFFAAELGRAPVLEIGVQKVYDLRAFDLGVGYSLDLLTAQVVVVSKGATALLRHRDTEQGPEKWTLTGNASPHTVRAFTATWAPEHGLVRVYGVPDRGYAGGYVE